MQQVSSDLLGFSSLMASVAAGNANPTAMLVHIASELVSAVACFCAALAIAWYARYRRGMSDEYRRVAMLLCAFALASGLTRSVGLAMVWLPFYCLLEVMEAFTASVTLVAAVAVWPRLPALIALPSSNDLLEANRRLAAEEVARRRLVESLTALNSELEARVAARTAELAEANHRFEVALAGSNITMVQQDRDLRYTWVYNPPEGMTVEGLVGTLPDDSLPKATGLVVTAAKRRVLETGTAERVEVALHQEGETRWFEERIEPVIVDDEIVGVVGVAIEVTPHKRYEQHLRAMLRELTHRSKNLLAVVQGIARQTGETVNSLPDFNARFGARLQALSDAHELLVGRAWRGVELGELVARELHIDLAESDGRVRVDGAPEILGPEAAQNVALGLHEMVTNAVAYGALSQPTGRVDISWRRVRFDERDMLELNWIERGGPVVTPPLRRGFGRSLIERLVPRAIEGTSDLVFAPEGLRWSLRFPVARLGEDG